MEANQKVERKMWKAGNEIFLHHGAVAPFRSSGGRCSVGAHFCGGVAVVLKHNTLETALLSAPEVYEPEEC